MYNLFLQNWWQFLIASVVSYCIGAINFSIIFSRLIKLQDVRDYGSGNAGTTNMFRVYGLPLGLLTFLCDCLKGVVACLVFRWIFSAMDVQAITQISYVSGFFAVVGHVFPVYYDFRGGKGVATSLGVIFSLQPILGLCLIIPIILLILIVDRMSVMALTLSVFMIIWSWVVLLPALDIVCSIAMTFVFLLVIFAHRSNIVRICQGKELRTGVRKALRGRKKQPNLDETND